MPSAMGISMHVETRVWEVGSSVYIDGKLYRFPEFPYKALKPVEATSRSGKTAKPLLPSFLGGSSKAAEVNDSAPMASKQEVSVYIPLLPKATCFRVAYSFIVPFAEGTRLEYRLFFNGKHIVSGHVTPQKMPRGYIARAIVEADNGASSNKKTSYEAMSFEFVVPKNLFKSRAEDGGLINVQWFRIEHTNPSEPKGLQSSKAFKYKYSIGFKPTGAHATVKHRDHLLKDAVDAPFATFKFYYRTWQSLREHHIVEDDEYDENASQAAPIGDSTRSLRSFEGPLVSPRTSQPMVISQPYNFAHVAGSQAILDSCIPIGLAQNAHINGRGIPRDIADTAQGRLVAQSNAKAQKRLSLQSERASKNAVATRGLASADKHNKPAPSASTSGASTSRPVRMGDRQSMISLTPSLKECVDREATPEESVMGLAQAVDLQPPKRRTNISGAHTGISGQFAGLKAHDESSSMLGNDSDQENENWKAPPRPRPTGIYQHDNLGLPHYGEHGLSSLTMSGNDGSSVIDEDFAASAYAPPTRGNMSAAAFRLKTAEPLAPDRNRAGYDVDSSPTKTPGGHDFPVDSPSKFASGEFLTPDRNTTGYIFDSSPTKTPGGHDFPVDPPGSEGFPVIEPGEIIDLSPSDGSGPGFSPEGGEGSVIYTPHHASARGLKPYGSLSRFRRSDGQFSPSPRFPSASSPLAEIEELNLSGTVKRAVSAYESPKEAPLAIRRRSLMFAPGRVAMPSLVRDEAEGTISQPRFDGPLSATPSAIALTNRKFGEAKSAIADIKLKLEARRKARDNKSPDHIHDLSWTADDENIETSSPIKRISMATQKLKENIRNAGKDAVTTTGVESACRRRPSSEDDPNHPMRRRSSTVKMTAQDWFASGRDTVALPFKSSIKRLLSPFTSPKRDLDEVSEFGRQLASSSKAPLKVGPHFVPEAAPVSDTVDNAGEAEVSAISALNTSSRVDQVVPPVSVVCVPDYAERVSSIVPPARSLNGGGEEQPSLEALFIDSEAALRNARLLEEVQRDGVALLQAAARHGILPSRNVVEAFRGPAVSDADAPAATSGNANALGGPTPTAQRLTSGNLLNLENPDPEGWVEHRGTIINPSGPDLRDAETVLNEIRMFNASPHVASGNYPRIHESQLDEYRARPDDWIATRTKFANGIATSLANAKSKKKASAKGKEKAEPEADTSKGKSSAKGKEKAEPEVDASGQQDTIVHESERQEQNRDLQTTEAALVQQAIANSLATAYGTTPSTEASGSAQHDRPSPRTPRGQMSAAPHIPMRSSSLRQRDDRGGANAETTPTRGAVTPTLRPVTTTSARNSPPPTPRFNSNALMNRPHPLGSPLTRSTSFMTRGPARLISITRSPSGMVTAQTTMSSRTEGNAAHAHPAPAVEQAEVVEHGHPAPASAGDQDVPRTAFGIPIRTANAVDLFAGARIPSFADSLLLPAPERSPETQVPGAWPKSPEKED